MSEGKRVKRWAPKVFSGCQTCKRRRIKCDETKPTCHRCARSGLACEGYQPPATRMFDPNKKASDSSQSSEQSSKLNVRSSMIRSTPSPGTAAAAFTTPEEQQIFEYFNDKTSNVISIYSHQPFWKNVLPNATTQHAAVKHSVLALAILHQSLAEEGHLSDGNHERLLTHYNNAIRALTKGQPPIDVVLMTCILFWAIENFNGNGRKSYDHVEAAIKILNEFKAEEDNRTSPLWNVVTEHIEPALRSAHIHITYNELEDMTVRKTEVLDTYGTFAQGLPRSFMGIEEATDHLRQCLRCVLKMLNDSNATREQIKADLAIVQTHLSRWLGLFHTLTVSARPTQRRMLFVHHVTATELAEDVQARLSDTEVDKVKSKARARWIVHELEEITNIPVVSTKTTDATTEISHELGVIAPLFVVATVCEDFALKAQAFVFLKKLDIREGQWRSSAAAKVAEVLLDWQSGSASKSRLCDLALGTNGAELTLRRISSGETVGGPIWEMLKSLQEVDLDVLTRIVQNHGYQLDEASSTAQP